MRLTLSRLRSPTVSAQYALSSMCLTNFSGLKSEPRDPLAHLTLFSGPNSAGGSTQRSSVLNELAFANACLGIDAVEQRPEMFCNDSRALIVKHTVVPAG